MGDLKRKREGRKAQPASDSDSDAANNELSAMDILKRHFESQFGSLETNKAQHKKRRKLASEAMETLSANDDDVSEEEYLARGSGESEDEGSQFDGFSDEDGNEIGDDEFTSAVPTAPSTGPEVISYTSSRPLTQPLLPKSQTRRFLSSKPISIHTSSSESTKRTNNKPTSTFPPSGNTEEDNETLNLKNDLALQRLLSESHLLDPTSATNTSISLLPMGKNRLKAIESRIQALGGKDLTKQKMPVPMRLGILNHRKKKEEKRVKSAREAGIVLEKKVISAEDKKKKQRLEEERKKKRRDKGFGPSVGKFRNGALVLSKKDVREIEGPKKVIGGGKGRKGSMKSKAGKRR